MPEDLQPTKEQIRSFSIIRPTMARIFIVLHHHFLEDQANNRDEQGILTEDLLEEIKKRYPTPEPERMQAIFTTLRQLSLYKLVSTDGSGRWKISPRLKENPTLITDIVQAMIAGLNTKQKELPHIEENYR